MPTIFSKMLSAEMGLADNALGCKVGEFELFKSFALKIVMNKMPPDGQK